MKWIKNLCIGLVLIGVADSCIKEPTYSVVPQIEFAGDGIIFKKGSLTARIPDTLIFKIKFKDGDGDLGYGPEDENSVYYYNPWFWAYSPTSLKKYITDSNIGPFSIYNSTTLSRYDRLSGITSLPDTLEWINWGATKLSEFDTLPGINCQNWQQVYTDDATGSKVSDSVYITQNFKAFNVNIDLYKMVGTNYVLYNPETDFHFPSCNFNLLRATFPDLSNDRKNAPLEGIITFRLQSLGLYTLFGGSTKLKIAVTINDRAFHASNTIAMKDHTLQQLMK